MEDGGGQAEAEHRGEETGFEDRLAEALGEEQPVYLPLPPGDELEDAPETAQGEHG